MIKLLRNKTIVALGFICAFTVNGAFASGSYHGGCNNDGGSETSTFCDSWGGAYNYDMFTNESNIEIGTDASSGNVVVDGVTIKVSAWADTGDISGANDSIIEQAPTIPSYSTGNDSGWGVINQDESDYGDYNNGGYSHAIDNFGGSITDYDMVLFSFSETVSLAGATFSWVSNNNSSNQEVTIVGLNDISGLSSGNTSWADIAGSNAVVTSASFSIEECEDVYVSEFTSSATAQYWLVGAYNTAFGYVQSFTQNNDAFKLASIGFVKDGGTTPPSTDINAPGSFALLMLSGGFVAWRNRQHKKNRD